MSAAQAAGDDARIGAWSKRLSAAAVTAQLQAVGVPAHAVLDTPGVYADEQLAHRGHFHALAHTQFGRTTIESSRLLMSRASAKVPVNAIAYGRDNTMILEQILGYSAQRCAELERLGVLT
ncbi:MAG: hypothetical protein HC809_09570 [Gammaproteobacteria bacterium]|nr:hypothetical protein [Gammaproteobacteria bacterium]